MEKGKKKKDDLSFIRKKKKPLPLIGLSLCVLVLGLLIRGNLLSSKSTTLPPKYQMDKDANGRYIFRVVEVVPEQTQSILGMFIAGEDKWTIPEDKLEALINSDNTEWNSENATSDFFYWDGKVNSTGFEPYTVITDTDGKRGLINNEIFKLYMLGIAEYDNSKSVYQNYLACQELLKQFQEEFVINYQVVTPPELEGMDLDKINYIHFGSGEQIRNYPSLYRIAGVDGGNWSESFVGKDFSWQTALKLYERAISQDSRMSVSFAYYTMMGTGFHNTMNVTKLFAMIHSFADPSLFQELFYGGGMNGNKNGLITHIDRENGDMVLSWARKKEWNDNWFEEEFNLGGNRFIGMQKQWKETGDGWIPEKFDNILVHYGPKAIYFTTASSIKSVNTILNFQESKPSEEIPSVEKKVKVLEIEPCADYKFAEEGGVAEERKKLADWLGTTRESLEVVSVTPNELNGLTLDISSEFDMIYIGDRTGKLGEGTSYRTKTGETGKYDFLPYQHIGSYQDALLTHTVLGGLLDSDKTTAEEFEQISGVPFAVLPSAGFLRNTELELSLPTRLREFSRARLSGNDLSSYMKGQLKEFIESDQPVVAADTVFNYSLDLADELKKSAAAQDNTLDANLYILLAETRFKEGAGYSDNVIKESECQSGSLKGLLKADDKPGLRISDVKGEADGGSYILELETTQPLTSLVKSRELVFSYEVEENRAGEAYVMKIIVDRNGDGIFTETQSGSKEQPSDLTQDSFYSFDITAENRNGSLTLPVGSGRALCLFRVIVEEKKGGLRKSFTGYMRPDGTSDVNILQIMSDGSEHKLSESEEFLQLLSEANLVAPEYHFDFEGGYTAVTASQFNDRYAAKGSLDQYNLIIAGFDFGTQMTDISGPALEVLKDYMSLQKKPVIFTKNTISYINTEYYKAPIISNEQWARLTEGEVKAIGGGGSLTEGADYRRVRLDQEAYNSCLEENKRLEETGNAADLDRRIYLEDTEEGGAEPVHYCWEKRIPPFSGLASVAGTENALYPEKAEWGYEMSWELRYLLGMDRFAVTTELTDGKKRDSGTVRQRKDAPKELQGFTNAALLEYTFASDAAGNQVSQAAPYGFETGVLPGKAGEPRTDTIEILNEGPVVRYPFELWNENKEKIEIEENQAAFYQLDLERENAPKDSSDVTVWFTFSGTKNSDNAMKAKSAYFETTARDAGNNYYLYSKNNIYYTGYNMPDKERAGLNDAQESEMKLFINTIYAALSTQITPEEAGYFDTVLYEDGIVSSIERSGQSGEPNRYVCYYEEGEQKLSLLFRIQKRNASEQETTGLIIGRLERDDENGRPEVAVMAGCIPYEITADGTKAELLTVSFPVVNIRESEIKQGTMGPDASQIWYGVDIPISGWSEEYPLVIGPMAAEGTETLDPGSVYAVLRMVKRDLFELD